MPERRDVARLWAGFALLGAGLIHLAVVREHAGISPLHGAFFVAAGGLQVLWAVMTMARTTAPLPRVVGAVQLGLVAMWAVSRTTGLPVAPAPWTREAVGAADLLAVLLELVALAALAVTSSRTRIARRTIRPRRFLAGAGAGALLAALLTTPALAATDAGQHANPHGHPAGSSH